MSTDWLLTTYNHTGDEVIPATPLTTMMIESDGTMGTFSASMTLSHEFLSSLDITSRNFFQLNYFSRSYPENSFILKDALLTSVNYTVNNGESFMHVEASWQYYRETEDREYSNELDYNNRNHYNFDGYELNYISNSDEWSNLHLRRTQHWKAILLNKSHEEIANWQSFGF